jgi:hypothetical protein
MAITTSNSINVKACLDRTGPRLALGTIASFSS